ncbi:hypothetical protein [Emcibacter sp.]|uniref:hypothetical protein n=1 Tax=Emcibacter sp. TaxID=1979954 RepID=UPI002AA9425A|nr:hypothetical protein [Emcibacter sp.]
MLKGYISDHTAQQVASETHLNINSVDRYFRLFRQRIVLLTGTAAEKTLPAEKNYPDNAGHILIGVLKKKQQAYAEIIAPQYYETAAGLLANQVGIEDIIYQQDWPGYDELIDISCDKRIRIRNTGISGFWDFAHLRLSKFRGMHKSTFLLHLKECEWRYNNRNQDLYALLLREFRQNPL